MRIRSAVNPWRPALVSMMRIVQDVKIGAKKDVALYDYLYRQFECSLADKNAYKTVSICLGFFGKKVELFFC